MKNVFWFHRNYFVIDMFGIKFNISEILSYAKFSMQVRSRPVVSCFKDSLHNDNMNLVDSPGWPIWISTVWGAEAANCHSKGSDKEPQNPAAR